MPCCNTAPYKRLQWLLSCPCSYTSSITKHRIGLYRCFSCDLSHSTTTDTRSIQAAIIPPAQRWSVSQRRNTSSACQIPPPRRTLYRLAQPPYYNKVCKGTGVQHTTDRASPAGSAPTVCGSLASADTLSAVQTRRIC